MAAPLLLLRDIHLTFGGPPLLEGAELSVTAGERLALVGRNGSGKSTLLKIAAGLIEPDRGERALQQGTLVRYLPQEPDMAGFATTLDYVAAGLNPHDDPYRARTLLGDFGFDGSEDPARLSGGEARRCALARVLAPDPDVLLMDEPTNHLDLPAIEWLENELKRQRAALVLISHDRRFLSNLTRTSVWLDRGSVRRFDRGFSEFEAWRDDMLEQEEIAQHKMDRKIAREEDWVRYGVSGRRKRNVKRLATLHKMRQDRREYRHATGNVSMSVAEAENTAKLVVEAKNINKSFGDRVIVKDTSIRIGRGDRIGIVGPNGAGKTTLLNMLTGALEPDSGTVKLGGSIQMVTLDQKRESLHPDETLAEVLTQGHGDMVTVGDTRKHVIGYMKDFLFGAEQAKTPVLRLSGGERGRLMLARALARPSNVLVLDEPTNDLDLETLDLLQEMLADYSGTVLLVSHDRDFLDRVVTGTIAYERDGKWTMYAGGYSDMVTQRGAGVSARDATKADKPKEAKKDSAPKAAAGKQRMGFKEKHALETLPKKLAGLRADIVKYQAKLADSAFFARDPKGFAKAAQDLEAAQAALNAGEDEWLTLEMLREELEG
jgi:ATP-binding cassette subfamily F protein uup